MGCRIMWDSTFGKPLWIYFRVGDLAMLGACVFPARHLPVFNERGPYIIYLVLYWRCERKNGRKEERLSMKLNKE